ncbi:DMT family transporter [Pantoea sp. B65]|uniref:DMT family transporter n=1 Tax=Pantoea sp. B65 TaxID=2813359 RepID=UPI0039B5F005
MGFIFIVISGLCSALAGGMLKIGAQRSSNLSLVDYWPHATSVALYFIGFLFYFLALSRLSLTVAYPVMISSAVIFVMLMGAFWFSEPVTMLKIVGTLLIISGVFLINYSF